VVTDGDDELVVRERCLDFEHPGPIGVRMDDGVGARLRYGEHDVGDARLGHAGRPQQDPDGPACDRHVVRLRGEFEHEAAQVTSHPPFRYPFGPRATRPIQSLWNPTGLAVVG